MIVAIGISVVDHIMLIDGFKKNEGTFHCENYIIEGGGMAATALCAASKLGAETRLFSRIGDDPNGQFIIDALEHFGVDTSGVVKVKGGKSTVSFVLIDIKTGEKQFYSERVKKAYTDPLELDVSLLEGARALLVDGHWIEAAVKGAQWANNNGIPVVADFKRMYDGLEKLFPFIDYFIIPLFFAREITGKQKPEAILKALASIQPGLPVITMGSEGGIYQVHDEIRRYRSFPVACVDSTGAGDAFHGAFCYYLSCGLSLEKCLELASAAGALNCRSIGGRAGLPSCQELSGFLGLHGSDPSIP